MSRLVNTWQARWCFFVVLAILLSAGLSGCANKGRPAPIEDRPVKTGSPGGSPSPATVNKPAPAPAPGVAAKSEAGSKPSTYTVKAGDTLRVVGRDFGVPWQDLVRWNKLENPNQIEVGQLLWLVPPPPGTVVSGTEMAQPQPAATSGGSRPVASVVAGGADTPAAKPVVQAPMTAPVAPASQAQPAPAQAAVPAVDDGVVWGWPTLGTVLTPFDAQKNKGISIGGNAGDSVVAAADGVVVYAGSGLRGYGNLVILKHNATFLTAYAHNQTLLVKEDQQVRRGQKIAEMGNSDTDRVKLHFEVRRNSTPVDPLRYLPAR